MEKQAKPTSSRLMYSESEIERYRFEFTKSYLSNLFNGRFAPEIFVVKRLVAKSSESPYRLRPITERDAGTGGGIFVLEDSVQATISYEKELYEITLSKFQEDFTGLVRYVIGVLGLGDRSVKPNMVAGELLRESLHHSPYVNKCLEVKPIGERGQVGVEVGVVEVEQAILGEVFLTPSKIEALQLFIDCVLRHDECGHCLRYLLSGKPGTAKTKIIRAIANAVKGRATVIFTNGSDDRIDATFALAECFSPAVVCIDDVDMLVGAREEDGGRQALGRFLQYLDGFLRSDVFLLATTNDKRMVDTAASRPGRFDMIIDVNRIDPKYYVNLVKTKTSSTQVIELFNEDVLSALEARKVSGAFITNLAKQLEIHTKLRGANISTENVIHLVDQLNKGFNKHSEEAGQKPGFSLS